MYTNSSIAEKAVLPITFFGGPVMATPGKAFFGSGPVLPDGFFSNQKIPIFVNFGGSCNGRCLYILCPFGQFSGYSTSFGH
jgi:hypothetical protein